VPRELVDIVNDAAQIGVAFDSVHDFAVACASEFFSQDDCLHVGRFIVDGGNTALAKLKHPLSQYRFVADNIVANLRKPAQFRYARSLLLFLADAADEAINT
jgi:hypothetical protein